MAVRFSAMENLVAPAAWAGRRVFLTGHTGFVGAWLAMWLQDMGAEVSGYALPPPTEPNLFAIAGVGENLARDVRADIREAARLTEALTAAAPDVVFHLAAQPLVLESYRSPVETFAVNAIGTANLLEAVRKAPSVRGVVIVTTDKCYANDDQARPFVETDPMGGHDPYSASKACAEIVAAAYRDSFFANRALIATARAGNIIGGGDWAADRLVPDCVRAAAARRPVVLRHPGATRPWQHVLDAVSGYLVLAQALMNGERQRAGAWNFGPEDGGSATNKHVASALMARLGGSVDVQDAATTPREAAFLSLDVQKARAELGWRPRWDLARTLAETANWYADWLAGKNMAETTHAQIRAYVRP
jgi:CDP-glucose 4,6-dehydratase